MTTDIFICSFPRDIEWLRYCLLSIHKFFTGHRQIHIAWPAAAPKPDFLTTEIVHAEPAGVTHGYSRHQVAKMRACQYSDADFVMFLDSDHFCLRPTDLSYFFDGDKPQLWARPFSVIAEVPLTCDGVNKLAMKWKPRIEHALGFEAPHFTLEFLPVIHPRHVLVECAAHIERLHGKRLEAYANTLHWEGFGDYMVMGAYALKFHPELYSIREIQPDYKWAFAGHSPYKGFPPEIKAQFEAALSAG
jgi:hypothetical protein